MSRKAKRESIIISQETCEAIIHYLKNEGLDAVEFDLEDFLKQLKEQNLRDLIVDHNAIN